MTESQPKKSDLPVRVASAVVMVAVAGVALWLGGWWWTALVSLIAIGVTIEWFGLTLALNQSWSVRVVWLTFGAVYVANAAYFLSTIRDVDVHFTIIILLAVVATDIGAYFTGRHFGGPKIAPAVSPSKTWSGLAGGMAAAALVGLAYTYSIHAHDLAELESYIRENGAPTDWEMRGWRWGEGLLIGCFAALIAQAGDFLESWMKRCANVKDSGHVLPGHGGLFDRVDGLLAVLTAVSIWIFGVAGSSQGPIGPFGLIASWL